jgi:hypothetical protein
MQRDQGVGEEAGKQRKGRKSKEKADKGREEKERGHNPSKLRVNMSCPYEIELAKRFSGLSV